MKNIKVYNIAKLIEKELPDRKVYNLNKYVEVFKKEIYGFKNIKIEETNFYAVY